MKKKSFFEENEYMTLDPNMKVCANPVPKTIARAIAFLEKHDLPPQVEKTKKSKKSTRTTLQNELLAIYTFDPTEEQMLQLKAFLAQLFADKLNASKVQEVEMVA